MKTTTVKKSFGKNYKNIVRDEIANLVKPDMTIFTLPYLNFQIERNAAKAYCCEKDTRTWARQMKLAPENCILHNAYASEIVGEVPFDLVFLDLCGSVSSELFKCLERVNLRTKRSKLIITLLKGREHPNYWSTIVAEGGRVPFMQRKLEENGLYLYQTIEYFDSSPMIVFFATKTKRKRVKTIVIPSPKQKQTQ